MQGKYTENENTLLVEEIQSLLQGKRTVLKAIRIGIAVFMAQIAAVGYLLAAFRRHAFAQEAYSMDALAALAMIMLVVAITLVVGAFIRIRCLDREILKFQ